MATIIYLTDPTGSTGSNLTTGFNGSITDYLMGIEGFDPEFYTVNLNGVDIELPINGEIPTDNRLFRSLCEFDRVTITAQPKGVVEGLIAAAISIAASVAVTLLMPKPSIPNDMGVVKNSPNNQLNEQTNTIRSYQAIPDIYGSPVPYPDLANKAALVEYFERTEGQSTKIITQLMVVSVGEWEVDEVYTSDTLLTALGGSYDVYYPDSNGMTTIPKVIEATKINEVDGQELYAPDQDEATLKFTTDNIPDSGNVTRGAGDDYTLTTTLNLGQMSNLNYPNDGRIKIIRANGDSQEANVTFTDFDLSSSTYTLKFTSTGAFEDTEFVELYIEATENRTVGPFKTESEGDQLWINLSFPRGLNGEVFIDVTYTMTTDTQEVTDTKTFEFNKNSFDQQNATIKIDSTIGRCKWTSSFIRTNNQGDPSKTPSMTKLEGMYVCRIETNKKYGNVTMIECVIPATNMATSLRENKINLRGMRKTITYNEVTGEIDYTLNRSRSGADAILHEWVEVFGQDPNALALDELYSIYSGLSDPRLGYFDFTIDDIDVSLGSRIEQMANAARVFLIPDGSVYRFKRDQLQSQANLLSRRELSAEDGYEFLYKPQPLSDKDSVRIEYVDNETNTKAYIERKWVNGVITEGVGVNPLVVQLDCVREEYNAMNRAELEIRKLYYLRTTIRDTFVPSIAMMQHKGDKVIYEDIDDESLITGEVIAINGSMITLSESVPDFTTYQFAFTDVNGDVMPYQTATKVGEKKISLTGDLTGLYVANQISNQKSSMYYLSESNPVEYIITERKPSSDGKTISLMMTQANDKVYEFDGVI